jgi:hypothetical protein
MIVKASVRVSVFRLTIRKVHNKVVNKVRVRDNVLTNPDSSVLISSMATVSREEVRIRQEFRRKNLRRRRYKIRYALHLPN